MAQYGSNWAATDWYCNQRQKVYFSYSVDVTNRQFIVTAYQTTECNDGARSPTYYVCRNTQYWSINGSNYSMSDSLGGIKVRGFTDNGSWLDRHYNGGVYPDYNGDYLGIRRDLYVYGSNWDRYTFRLNADAAGKASFSVSGNFAWYNSTRRTYSTSFSLSDNKLKQKYTIQFDSNKNTVHSPTWNTNELTDIPSNITKVYGDNIKLPNNIPICSPKNYVFQYWSTKPDGSGTKYNPGDTFSVNANTTLYAIWAPKVYRTHFMYSDFTTKSDYSWFDYYYYDKLVVPSATYYGRTLKHWVLEANTLRPTQHNPRLTFVPNSKYTVWGEGTLNPEFIYNNYTFTLLDKNGNTLRTVSCKYAHNIVGDFTYSIPGYDCIGWSTTKMDIFFPDVKDEDIPVADNKLKYDKHKDAYSNKVFLKNQIYTSNTNVKSYIGENITLYPILRYKTSMYVYTPERTWKLAMPYVYANNKWNMTLGYIKDTDNKWKL